MKEILMDILWIALTILAIIGTIALTIMCLVFIFNLVTEIIDDIFGGNDE